jgi:GNAT superfamily N-acetyltransferase
MSRLDTVRQVIDALIATAPDPGTRTTAVGPLLWFHLDRPFGWATDVFRAIEVEPVEVVRAIQSCGPGPHLIRTWTTDLESSVPGYAGLGYRALPPETVETIMARSLVGFIPGEERYPVQRVRTEEQRRVYNTAFDPALDPDDPHGPIKAEELGNLALRHYFVELDGQCAGYARAILPLSSAVMVEPLWTRPEYRRRGIATALMNRLHAEAAEGGAAQGVIMASPMGVPLYTRLGYEIVAFVQKFVPAER